MSDAPYEVLAGRYELHRQLATGGSADVFLARDQLLNRPVAVKILNATLSQDENVVESIRQEAQVVASLNHQNIVGVFDQGQQDGAPFIVMEYVDGQSLAEILRNEGTIDPDRAASVAVDIAAALDAAHRQGMVHMDVKPGNVLVTEDGQVKLADFGIAKALNAASETDHTAEDGHVMGTATYLSPEQAQGQKVGPRSDVYSLAVVLYEMLAGRPPFVGDSAVEISRQHVEQAPEALRAAGVDIAQSLEAITLKGLSKNKDHRYPSVRDFAADLKRYLGGAHSLGSSAPAETATTTTARPVTGRSTPPDDDTVVMPVASAPQDGVPRASAPRAAPARVAVAPTPAREEPTVVEPRPVDVRSDDTWKRNVLFLVFFLVLLVLLGFLANSLFAVLSGNSTDTDAGTTVPVTAETVEVASFIDLEQSQAEALIEQAGLVPLIDALPNNDTPEGLVFAQDPPAGAIVEAGSTIAITISEAEGLLEVPTLTELTREEAERQLARRGFNSNVVEVDHATVPAGVVIRQEPGPGASQQRGSVVFFEVSLGPSERTVPDLAGEEFNDALEQLFELDFRTAIVEEASEDVEEGLVLRTEPEAGALVRGGDVVTIFQSTGVARVAVPSVVGLLPDTARQQLVASGFEVEILFEPAGNPNDINRVLRQRPNANVEQREGEVVRIFVGEESDENDNNGNNNGDTNNGNDGQQDAGNDQNGGDQQNQGDAQNNDAQNNADNTPTDDDGNQTNNDGGNDGGGDDGANNDGDAGDGGGDGG